jgi:hypothetical protein
MDSKAGCVLMMPFCLQPSLLFKGTCQSRGLKRKQQQRLLCGMTWLVYLCSILQ